MKATLSPKADADLEEIGDYIAQDNPLRAASFVREIREKVQKLSVSARAYRSRDDLAEGLHAALHGRYMIVFRILENEIRVERIVHGARDLKNMSFR